MSMATRTDAQPSAPHDADSHDLIRVQGARENNLKDVSVELPKRRLTVFTGVSGSGKSSLVFGTIAAESQRMINETYSAFVQGFMPSLARPDVDVLEGLTTAIIVDQERMGANARSTVGTVTDANAMLRILFSRLGQPHVGSPQAFSFNIPTVQGSGAITIERGGTGGPRSSATSASSAACARAARAWARSPTSTSRRSTTRPSRSTRARSPFPATPPTAGRRDVLRVRVLRRRQADPRLHRDRAARLPVQGAHQGQDQRHQHHLRGPRAEGAEVLALQGRRRDAAAHPRVRRAGGRVHGMPRLRRHPAQRGCTVIEDRRHQHRRRVRDADQRPGRVGRGARRAVRRAAAGDPPPTPRLVRRDRARLPLARPALGHAVGRRGAAHEDDPAPRLVAHRRHLRLRRADRSACTRTTSSG